MDDVSNFAVAAKLEKQCPGCPRLTRCKECEFGSVEDWYSGHLLVICQKPGEGPVSHDSEFFCAAGTPAQPRSSDAGQFADEATLTQVLQPAT